MKNQLKAGVVLSYISTAISIVIQLIYMSVMIRLLGKSEYGLYSLVFYSGSVEKPYQLLDDAREILPLRLGDNQKIDSEYVRNSTCSIVAFVEPLGAT